MFKKTTLENGLRIITVPQENTEAVTVLVLVGTGSKYEEKEVNGISHFLEHMYFKGTKKQPTYLEVAETLDKIGGIYNAFTAEDYTGYFAKVSAGHLDTALEWVSDIFLNSILPKAEIEKEKGVIKEELNMHQDIPMNYVQLLWARLLYGDQPAGRDIVGTKETLSKMTREKLLSYMKSQYVASNTIICVAGKMTASKTLVKVKRYFAKITTAKPAQKPPVFERQTAPESLIYFKETDQSHLCLGVRAYNLSHPLRYAQELLGVILGGMMSSRLFVEVRERLGLTYYIKTAIEDNADTGYLVTQVGVDNKRVEQTISVILKEYKRVSQEKISAAELKKAKDYVKGKMVLELEPSDTKAFFYAGQELLEKKILLSEQVFKKIDKVSENDILKVAGDIFRPENLNVALVGPFKDKDKFSKLLNDW
ncbi:MAG: pitrilysin family protein [bacterium]